MKVSETRKVLANQQMQFSLETVWMPSCESPDVKVRNSESFEGLNATADGEVSSSRSGFLPDGSSGR